MKIELESLDLEITDGIAVISMHAPMSNKMTTLFIEDYIKACTECINVLPKGLIITGGKRFSTGADVDQLTESFVSETQTDAEGNVIKVSEGHILNKKIFTSLWNVNFPVISAIGGFCIGSGCEIALSSHFRVCEANATIGLPESTFGLLPGMGGIARSSQISGLARALEIVYSGEMYSAEEAYKLGLADIITPKKESFNTSLKLMDLILGSGEYKKAHKKEYLRKFQEVTIS